MDNIEEKMSIYNKSHCLDKTAHDAIMRADAAAEQKRVNDLIHIIRKLCDICDFSIEERIVLKDVRTGRVWR